MDQRLFSITKSGSVDALYSVINEDPNILETVDVLPFIHTPLHEAASTGKIDLAMELMIVKPSFAKKLNKDGFSPLHLAVENHQVELARELVKFDPSLIRIRGRGGMTPLHFVVKKGDVDLLTEFLVVCGEGIKDANVNGETALHMAVINDDCEVVEVVRGWMQRLRNSDASALEIQVLNRGDREGNTALHLAAEKNNHKAVKELLKCMSLNPNIRNKFGMTALDVLRAHGPRMNTETEKMIEKAGGKSLAAFSSDYERTPILQKKPLNFKEYCSTGLARYRSDMSDGTRNALLVITALIIAATYQTASQPKDEQPINLKVVDAILQIVLLWGFNTIAFCLAIVLTFLLIPIGRAYTWWYISISVPLVCSYAISVYLKYTAHRLFIYLYLLIIFGFLIYLLVFYIKWKRTTQKKVPQPKSLLISQDHGLAI